MIVCLSTLVSTASSFPLTDRRVIEELEYLQNAAWEAEHRVAEAYSQAQDALHEATEEALWASRFCWQLDFLEGHESQILHDELECADLLDSVGIWTPPAVRVGSPAVSVVSPSFLEILLVG